MRDRKVPPTNRSLTPATGNEPATELDRTLVTCDQEFRGPWSLPLYHPGIVVMEDCPTDGPEIERNLRHVEFRLRQYGGAVQLAGNRFVLKADPSIRIDSRAHKMSKSRGNVVNPDVVVRDYGADSLRLYEMFMGPLEQVKPWSMSGVEGVSRFLGRVWRMIVDADADEVALHPAVQDVEPTAEQERILHRTIQAVSEDIEKLSLNTAISRMMEFTNAFTGYDPRPRACLEPFVLLLSPFAPHIAEELWEVLGHKQSLACHPWPEFDEAKIAEAEIEIPVQVNGKLRGKVKVPAEADQATMQQIAEADETVQPYLAGKQVVKVVCVPKKMVNFVVKG
jgi:leucyl-tRNA synthetase